MVRSFALACIAALVLALGAPAWGSRAAPPGSASRAEVVIKLDADGRLTTTGVLPRNLSAQALAERLPGADVTAIDRQRTGPAAEWGRAFDALSIVLPRFRTVTARLETDRLAVEGELKRGLSAAGVEAALRAALGTAWRLELDLVEAPPLAEIVIDKRDERVLASGLLPDGLAPPDALALLGEQAQESGLAGGGAGDAQAWAGVLSGLARTLDRFASATARISEGTVTITGVLRPGYAREAIARRIGEELPGGWEVVLEAGETPPSEGDRRLDLATGEPQGFRRGYWLPEVNFPVSPERCRAEADAALGERGLPFVDGTAEFEQHGLPIVNRLAAIAIRCLNSSTIGLEIGGHTDSVGNDRENEELSQARAEAVRQALLERGVREEAVSASGYGESRPVATNNTPEGRQRNRRITLEWSEPAG